NGDILKIEKGEQQLLLNNSPTSLETTLKNNDRIIIKEPETITVKEILNMRNENFWQKVQVLFNDEKVILKQARLKISRNNKRLTEDDSLYPGDRLTIESEKTNTYIFQDIFRLVDIKQPANKTSYQLYKNDAPCSFHEPIIDGDRLQLKWTNE